MRRFAAIAGLVSVSVQGLTGCDGVDPLESGCAATATTVDSAVISSGGYKYALLELRYSSECRSAWARVTLTSGLACKPGDDHCATATIVRNSDGKSFTCGTPAGVGTSCYTAQLNDEGVTSHAQATFDNGPKSYFAKTGSFSPPYDPDEDLSE